MNLERGERLQKDEKENPNNQDYQEATATRAGKLRWVGQQKREESRQRQRVVVKRAREGRWNTRQRYGRRPRPEGRGKSQDGETPRKGCSKKKRIDIYISDKQQRASELKPTQDTRQPPPPRSPAQNREEKEKETAKRHTNEGAKQGKMELEQHHEDCNTIQKSSSRPVQHAGSSSDRHRPTQPKTPDQHDPARKPGSDCHCPA
ncbi:hypothetical protein CVT26_008431 [Gymnopilus dilepis]|uniref:Uncharacterized protein n=1 Tax=Gymnopilus dilepis TaxID=231916 RepID=A0A409YFU2_9AGAR|nr:hypothetical protein CVT26_008431 [Gymnopilus dilepis]